VRVYISANLEVFTGRRHRSCRKGSRRKSRFAARREVKGAFSLRALTRVKRVNSTGFLIETRSVTRVTRRDASSKKAP